MSEFFALVTWDSYQKVISGSCHLPGKPCLVYFDINYKRVYETRQTLGNYSANDDIVRRLFSKIDFYSLGDIALLTRSIARLLGIVESIVALYFVIFKHSLLSSTILYCTNVQIYNRCQGSGF